MSFTEGDVLEIPSGLFGYADETRFLLLEVPSAKPIVFLQSIKTPNLCFISLPAQVVDTEYALSLNRSDLKLLGYSKAAPPKLGKDVLCLALLTIRSKETTTANLLAPIVIDIRAHRGAQVQVTSGYSAQHPFLLPESQFAC